MRFTLEIELGNDAMQSGQENRQAHRDGWGSEPWSRAACDESTKGKDHGDVE
jgi:hypothetical protein